MSDLTNNEIREIKAEMLKCKYDAVYFYSRYVTIKGKVPPPLSDFDKDMLRKYTNTEVCGCGPIVCEELGNCRKNKESLTDSINKNSPTEYNKLSDLTIKKIDEISNVIYKKKEIPVLADSNSPIKDYCDKNKIPYKKLKDGGVAIDISDFSPEQMSDIKNITNLAN